MTIQRVTFLGTSSAMPQIGKRNMSSVALTLQNGAVVLIDCGEGTQHQLMRSTVKLSRIRSILITHLHGDHWFGLVGLVSTLGLLGKVDPMQIVGPRGIEQIVRATLAVSGGFDAYELVFHELDGGAPVQIHLDADPTISVIACPIEHTMPSHGYVLREPEKLGQLDIAKAKSLGVSGPLLGDLKRGVDVQLPNGTIVRSGEVVDAPRPGRCFALMTDTCSITSALPFIQDCDLLIHECTYDKALGDKAREFGHSTSAMAAEAGRSCRSKVLVLTHFSTRYTGSSTNGLAVADLLREACETAPELRILAAEDFLSLRGPDFTTIGCDLKEAK